MSRRPTWPTSSVSLSLPVGPDLLSDGPSPVRTLLAAGVLAASAALAHALRRSPADAQRRRLLRRLDRVAPRRSYSSARDRGLLALNAACPVCLAEFAAAPDRTLRVQNECRHALCAECLETWVLHTTKAHLNPARFGLTRGGDIVSWHCPPNCPLCRNKIPVISDADIREAIIAAVTHQGGALSTFTSSAPQFHGFPPSIFLT